MQWLFLRGHYSNHSGVARIVWWSVVQLILLHATIRQSHLASSMLTVISTRPGVHLMPMEIKCAGVTSSCECMCVCVCVFQGVRFICLLRWFAHESCCALVICAHEQLRLAYLDTCFYGAQAPKVSKFRG